MLARLKSLRRSKDQPGPKIRAKLSHGESYYRQDRVRASNSIENLSIKINTAPLNSLARVHRGDYSRHVASTHRLTAVLTRELAIRRGSIANSVALHPSEMKNAPDAREYLHASVAISARSIAVVFSRGRDFAKKRSSSFPKWEDGGCDARARAPVCFVLRSTYFKGHARRQAGPAGLFLPWRFIRSVNKARVRRQIDVPISVIFYACRAITSDTNFSAARRRTDDEEPRAFDYTSMDYQPFTFFPGVKRLSTCL